jgi:DNA polymerase III epsilon subunit-like protein
VDETVAVFDFETTGVNVKVDRPIQIAAIIRGTDLVFNQLCDPQMPIPPEASEVHGITNEKVAGQMSYLEALQEFQIWVAENVPENTRFIIAGHNVIGYDLRMLAELTGINITVDIIDTLVCATRLTESPNHKLSTLIQHLKLGSIEGAHDALADIRMVDLLITHYMAQLGLTTLSQLAEWCVKPQVLKRAHFGKHLGKIWGRGPQDTHVPFQYARFIRDKFDSLTPDLALTLKTVYGLEK